MVFKFNFQLSLLSLTEYMLFDADPSASQSDLCNSLPDLLPCRSTWLPIISAVTRSETLGLIHMIAGKCHDPGSHLIWKKAT